MYLNVQDNDALQRCSEECTWEKSPPKNCHPHSRKLSPESYLPPGKFPPVKLPSGKMAPRKIVLLVFRCC